MTEVILIVKFRTTGGRHLPRALDGGKLVEVEIDGQRRPAKTTMVGTAYNWLQAQGFEPAGFEWMDRAGYIRRRKQTYRKEESAQG